MFVAFNKKRDAGNSRQLCNTFKTKISIHLQNVLLVLSYLYTNSYSRTLNASTDNVELWTQYQLSKHIVIPVTIRVMLDETFSLLLLAMQMYVLLSDNLIRVITRLFVFTPDTLPSSNDPDPFFHSYLMLSPVALHVSVTLSSTCTSFGLIICILLGGNSVGGFT